MDIKTPQLQCALDLESPAQILLEKRENLVLFLDRDIVRVCRKNGAWCIECNTNIKIEVSEPNFSNTRYE